MSDVRGLADEYWSYYRGTEQLWNVDRGDVEQIEHWEDLSASGVADRIARLTAFAQQAEKLYTKGLDDQQLTLLGALTFSARATAAGLPYRARPGACRGVVPVLGLVDRVGAGLHVGHSSTHAGLRQQTAGAARIRRRLDFRLT